MEPKDKERFLDQWLDQALPGYGSAEARSGLEKRVLAHVRAEQELADRARRRWWPVRFATASAVALAMGAFLIERPSRTSGGPSVANRQSASVPVVGAQHVPQRSSQGQATHANKASASLPVRKAHQRLAGPVAKAEPKLEQFPSPTPLSEQERMLLRYVRESPGDAVLEAQVRTELMQREIEERQKSADSRDSEPR